MKPVTVVIQYATFRGFTEMLASMAESPLVEQTIIVSRTEIDASSPKCTVIKTEDALTAGRTLMAILSGKQTKYLLLFPYGDAVFFTNLGLEKMLEAAESSQTGIVYSDFFEEDEKGKKKLHPLNRYQAGSVRDDFDFGRVILFSVDAVQEALKKHGPIPDVMFAGLYDLRLKVSTEHPIHHMPEPLYSIIPGSDGPSKGHNLFAYVDPRNASVQKEMESVFTEHLKEIGAFLPPEALGRVIPSLEPYPVDASIIIPVRNRKRTIADAVESALSQKTDFPFNVIVVDNYSTDGTTEVLDNLKSMHGSRMRHVIPSRTDLGIGGCWNEGLHSDACGRYAVQLDSDDLYSTPHTLQSIVGMLREGNYALVIGAYTLVNERLEEIPPGLIDHAEWTDENGHNNALRINGLGAPRAFDTGLMRKIDFLNVSYGEDYAAALRICREYRIGRIFESLYLCRRWSGNTDAALSLEAANKNNDFKDSVRTKEIKARQEILKGRV